MAGINKGDSPVSRITVGDNDVSEVYQGDTLIWQGDTQYSDPFWDDVLFLMPADNPSANNPDLTVKQPSGTTVTANIAAGTGGNVVVNSSTDGYNGLTIGKPVNQIPAASCALLYFLTGSNQSPYFAVSTPFTIEFWLYYAGSTIIEGGVTSYTAYPMTTLSTGGYRFEAKSGGGITSPRSQFYDFGLQNTSPETVVGQWQHHAVVRDSSNVIKYYIDGNESSASATSSAQMGSNSATYPVAFGGFFDINTRQYGCNAIVRQIRYTSAARYTSDFTPFQRFYYTGIS